MVGEIDQGSWKEIEKCFLTECESEIVSQGTVIRSAVATSCERKL